MPKTVFRQLAVLLLPLLLAACASSWSARLIDASFDKWSTNDRKGFLIDSPWVQHERGAIKGWKTETKAALDVTASWVSPFFKRVRDDILLENQADILPLLEYNPEYAADVAVHRQGMILSDQPPYPLPNHLIVPSPLFKTYPGLWPSGPEAAYRAHRALFIVPGYKEDIETILNGFVNLSDTIVIDLTLVPAILLHNPRPGDADIDTCMNALLGQLATRGTALIRSDGEIRYPRKAVVLGHDIQRAWEMASWRMAKQGDVVISAPTTIRLLFDRQDEEGHPWLGNQEETLRMTISAPRESAHACAENESEGLSVELEIRFDLNAMRQVGQEGI